MAIILKEVRDVKIAPLAAAGLTGGWLAARETGIRPLGGAISGTVDAYAVRTRNAKTGILGATGLIAVYLSAFGLLRPLVKKIGAWPSVLAVTALAADATAVADSKQPTQGVRRQV